MGLHRAPLSWNGTTAFHPIKAKGFQSALYTWMNNPLQAWPAWTAPCPAGLQGAHKLVSVPLQRSLPRAPERATVPAWASTTAQEPSTEHNSLGLASTANCSTAHHQQCCSRACCRAGSSINPRPGNTWEGACGAGTRCKCICSQNTQTGNARRNFQLFNGKKKTNANKTPRATLVSRRNWNPEEYKDLFPWTFKKRRQTTDKREVSKSSKVLQDTLANVQPQYCITNSAVEAAISFKILNLKIKLRILIKN